MKLGLKINDDLYVNKNHIVMVRCDNTEDQRKLYITLTASNPSSALICVELDTNQYISYMGYSVPVNEFHRIYREIKEYLGIDEVKDEVKVEVKDEVKDEVKNEARVNSPLFPRYSYFNSSYDDDDGPIDYFDGDPFDTEP